MTNDEARRIEMTKRSLEQAIYVANLNGNEDQVRNLEQQLEDLYNK